MGKVRDSSPSNRTDRMRYLFLTIRPVEGVLFVALGAFRGLRVCRGIIRRVVFSSVHLIRLIQPRLVTLFGLLRVVGVG